LPTVGASSKGRFDFRLEVGCSSGRKDFQPNARRDTVRAKQHFRGEKNAGAEQTLLAIRHASF
jgi:hypothetical protein